MPHDSAPHRHDSGPLLFLLGLVIGLLVALVAERLAVVFGDRDLLLVRHVRDLALEEFVEEVPPQQLIDDALDGMLEGLDPYSQFYGPDEVAQVNRETTGEFRGIGVVFRLPTTDGQILFAFPDSPAAAAGLGVGDRLVEVAGRVVAELDRGELQATIQAHRDGPLVCLVEDLGGERRTVELVPEPVVDPTVRHARMLAGDGDIGYLAIHSFTQRTAEEFDRAIGELEAAGMRRLVLDLRSNGGGILDAAVHVANRFIREGTIVATRTRAGTHLHEADPEQARLADLPLVVLVNRTSASASEVLAGALQDHGVAALLGETTWGKGTVQTLRQFTGERGIVKLTTAHYYTPSGRRIERDPHGENPSGLAPDHLLELEDEELGAVHAWLQQYSPPPALVPRILAWEESSGRELLPRPPEDRQLAAAVDLLERAANGGPRAF